jgi:chitinase
MEDMVPQDGPNFVAFIKALRAHLDTITPRPVLTTSVGWEYPVFAQLVDEFDQINLMTYDMSGAWPGWVSWHNAPIYSGGATLPGTTKPLPSADRHVSSMMSLGVPASKIGIGIDFYGYVWSGGGGTTTGGVTEPGQSWATVPSVQANVTYCSIMDSYYQTKYYRWDSTAQAAFLSIDNPGSSDDKFISYDDETTCQKKIEYVSNKGLGGVIIFELGAGYRANKPTGQRDLLLQAVKRARSSLQRSW